MKAVTGFNTIEEYLKSNSASGYLLISKEGKRQTSLADLAASLGYETRKVDDDEITRISGTKDHRGLAFVFYGKSSIKQMHLEDFIENAPENALVLILDGVTDPNNFGAAARSAEQFGVNAVIVPKDNSAHKSPAAAKASAGALSHIPLIVVPNLSRALAMLKDSGFWIYGADMEGSPLWDADFSGKIALVMGSEGRGLRRLTAESCDLIVAIPATGKVDSLNVSVAAGSSSTKGEGRLQKELELKGCVTKPVGVALRLWKDLLSSQPDALR